MTRLPRVEDCTYGARCTARGEFVGYVEEFPDVRTRPRASRLDALDDVVTMTREKLRQLADAADDRRAAPRSTPERHGT